VSLHFQGTVPPLPTVVQSSTVGTEYFVTPSSTAVETPAPTAQNAQRPQLTQQNALRLLQTQMSRSGGNISGINPAQLSPAVIQNILVAAKNGNIDLGNPALQQFKNLLMLQQEQKQGQLSMNPGAAAAAAAMPGPVPMAPSGDQTFQAAMNGQKAPPAPANVAVPAQTANNSPAKLWSGDIAWVMNGVNGQQNCERLFAT